MAECVFKYNESFFAEQLFTGSKTECEDFISNHMKKI